MSQLEDKLHELDPAALEIYTRYQRDRIGSQPLAEGGHDWPAWLTTEAREVSADSPIRGWRMFALVEIAGQPRLVAPFITTVHGASPDVEGLTWMPGQNTSSPIGCPKAAEGHHPLRSCRCGLRCVQSLTILRAFARNQAPRIGPMVAYAEVDCWGTLAPHAKDDDWERTLRAQHVQIVGPLYVDMGRYAHRTVVIEALSAHYGVPVHRVPLTRHGGVEGHRVIRQHHARVTSRPRPSHDVVTPRLEAARRAAPTITQCASGHTHWGQYGAAGLLLVDDGRLLLQRRPEGIHEGGTWSTPGGALTKGEQPLHAALREAHEETGIEPGHVVPFAALASDCGGGWVYSTILAHPTQELGLRANWESEALDWVGLDALADLDLHPAFEQALPTLMAMMLAEVTAADITQVTERVWTGADRGDVPMLAHAALLQLNGITHVLDCRPEGGPDRREVQANVPGLTYLVAGTDDDGSVPDSWFDRGVDYALAALADPGARVLAHCHQGRSRGPSMAFAILLATGMDADAARAAITSARPIAEIRYADDAIAWWARRTA